MSEKNVFETKKIPNLVFGIALPSMLAQFISVLYSIVDRMFVGNIPGVGNGSLAGVGVCGPVLTMIGAFAFWISIGGTPLMGISLGEGNRKKAESIVANCFVMLCAIAFIITLGIMPLRRVMLHAFGASESTYPYAEAYFKIYLSGTVFALISQGMNQFIIAQGYAKAGMFSVIIGAVMNILLDPVFIFVFDMGVRGAALATIISQAASTAFVLVFLFTKADIKITFRGYSLKTVGRVLKIGLTPFLIIGMDNLMIIAMNAMLQKYGGAQSDTLITCNTIVQSFMLVLTMPLGGISGGTQGIISYNYGACRSDRVIKAEKYIIGLCMGYTAIMFVLARVAGPTFASLFTSDAALNAQACKAIRICTAAAVPLGAQYAIVDGFTAMGQVCVSLPLSLERKAFYFAAVFIIPVFADASKIFYAEPISDIFGPAVSIPIFLLLIKKILRKRELTGQTNTK